MRRIMYVENKSGGLDGSGRIGWVELSRSRHTYTYDGRALAKTGSGYKYNCIDVENGDRYWVSGPRKDGADKLYGGVVQIDEARASRATGTTRGSNTGRRCGGGPTW